MKRSMNKFLALMMAFVLTFALAACGSGKTDETEVQTETEAQTETEVQTEAPAETEAQTEAPADTEAVAESADAGADTATDAGTADDSDSSTALFNSVEEMAESPLMDTLVQTFEESLADSGMSISIASEGNSLVFNFTIEDEELASQMTEDVLAQAMETQRSTFESAAADMSTAVTVDDFSVTVQYLTTDGTVLYSEEFFPPEA